MRLTIGIKALNEERHIAAALASAVAAAAPFAGEVILADSGSTDRTIAIARTFPIRILQLADPTERSCGVGAQLAFQEAAGEYFYLLDGDMVIDPAFLPQAIAYLDGHPRVGGVGGLVREVNVENTEFQIRAAAVNADRNWLPGEVDRLDCGGLYRTAAIRYLGYFADRNLHAFEEFELGARLRANGWRLARIDCHAVDHYGHTANGYALLWKRMRSGYAGAPGEVLRGAIGAKHLPNVLKGLGHIRNGIVVMLWWGMVAIALLSGSPLAALALLALPIAWLSYRRGSPSLGLYSFAVWNSVAIGLIAGLLRSRKPPRSPIATVTIRGDAPALPRPGDAA